MATKKPAAPAKKPAAKSTSTALAVWEKEMEAAAVAQGSVETNTGGFKSISLKGGILSVDDNAVEDNELRVVILAAVHENQMYLGDFDPSTPASPACYAFGENEDEMAPNPEHNMVDKQADLCSGCWANEWGSADKGKGKACKNVRRLMVVTEDALEDADTIAEAEMRMMKLPVMSVKNWTNYVKNTLAEDVKRPSWGVVTLIKLVPDAKSQFKVQFKFEEVIQFDQETYDALKKKVAEAGKNIASEYPVFEPEEKPARGGRKVIPIKPAAKGKAEPAAKGKAPAAAPAKRTGKY